MYREGDQQRAEIRADSEIDATELTIIGAFRFGLASSTASEHLGLLRRAGLADWLPYEVES